MDVPDGSPASAPVPAWSALVGRLRSLRPAIARLGPLAGRLRGGLERGFARLKDLGVDSPVVEQFIELWKRVGALRAAGILVAMLTPLAKFVVVPQVASSALATWAQAYGVDVRVRDWSADLIDLEVTAHEVVVTPHARYSQPDLLNADNVVIDLSLWRRLTRGTWTQQVRLEGAQVTFERLQTGHWNWSDVADSDAGREEFPAVAIPRLVASDLRVRWIEHLRGASGSGIVNESIGTIHLDDADLSVSDLAGPDDPRSTPSTVVLKARSGDGRVVVEGAVNVFRWGRVEPMDRLPGAQRAAAMRLAPFRHDVDWAPDMRLKVYLENVGAAAMGRMIGSATIVPVAGYVTGDVEFLLRDRDVIDCRTTLQLRDVKFTVNEDAARLAGLKPDVLAAQLATVVGSGRVVEACNGSLLDPGYRTLNVVQAAMTRETMRTAPPMVRAAALTDVKTLTGSVPDDVIKDLGRGIGGEVGEAVATSLFGPSARKATSSKPKDDNIARKSWRGIKKVFGKG